MDTSNGPEGRINSLKQNTDREKELAGKQTGEDCLGEEFNDKYSTISDLAVESQFITVLAINGEIPCDSLGKSSPDDINVKSCW